MKKTVKFICLLAAAAVITAAAVFSASAESTAAESSGKPYRVLAALGIASGEERGEDELVTRAEFCGMVLNFINSGYTYGGKSYYYSDVPASKSCSDAVYALSEMGIVNGVSDGIFKPDDPVTVNQAAAMLVKALNCYHTLLQPVQYPSSYTMKAYSLGIFDGVKTKNEEFLTLKDAYQVLYNALEVPIPQLNSDGTYMTDSSYTALKAFWKLYKARGICDSNDLTALTSAYASGCSKTQISVDGTVYEVKNEKARDFLGYNVEYYYNENNEIFYIEPYNNEIISIDYRDIFDVNKNVFRYERNGRTNRIEIPGDADLIYNGTAYPEYDAEAFRFLDGTGTIEFIDNDDDGKYECVKVEEYETYIINYLDEQNKILYYFNYRTENGENGRFISLDGADTLEIVRSDGTEIPMSQFYTNDAASVFASHDGSYIRVIVSPQKLNGSVAAKNQDTLTINCEDGSTGDYYLDCRDTMMLAAMETGFSGEFILNFRGEICGVTNSFGEEFTYGYLIRAYLIEEGDISMQVKILGEDGKINRYDFTDASRIDGTKYKDLRKAYEALTLVDTKAGGVRYTNQQMIRFKTADGGSRVTYIDTAEVGERETADTSLEMVTFSDKSYKYRPNQRYLSRRLVIDVNDLVCFAVPQLASGYNPSEIMNADDEYYYVKYDVYGYIKSESVMIDAAVTDKEGGSSTRVLHKYEYIPGLKAGGNPTYENRQTGVSGIIDSVSMGINADNETVPFLNIIIDTDIISVECAYTECMYKPVYGSDGKVIEGKINTLEKGDAVTYYTDENGTIRYVITEYDVSRTDNGRFMKYNSGDNSLAKGSSCGIIYSKSAKAMKMLRMQENPEPYDPENPFATFDPDNIAVQIAWLGSGIKMFVYDSENEEVRKANIYDIRDYKSNPSNQSIVYQKEEYTIPKVIYIYN